MRRTLIKLGLLTAAGLFCVGWLAVEIGQLNGPAGLLSSTYKLSAAFTDATGVVGGDPVRMAGVDIGKVGGVSVQRGAAVVSLHVDKRYKVPAGSHFQLRWKNLLGQRYVEVLPPDGAQPQGPAMAAGTRAGTDQTGAAADLSYLLNNTEPLLANLDTDSVNRFMETLAAALQGREQTLGEAISQSSQLVGTLSARANTIGLSISQMATLLDDIAGHDQQLRQLLGSLGTTSQALAGKSADLGNAVTAAGQFTGTLDRVLTSGGQDLDSALHEAQAVAAVLAKNKDALGQGVRTLNWTATALIRSSNAGDWLNIYGRSFGLIDTFNPEPRIGPDYSNAGPDATRGPGPWLGQPRAPTPAIPDTQAGPLVVNPAPGQKPSSDGGLQQLLAPLEAGG